MFTNTPGHGANATIASYAFAPAYMDRFFDALNSADACNHARLANWFAAIARMWADPQFTTHDINPCARQRT